MRLATLNKPDEAAREFGEAVTVGERLDNQLVETRRMYNTANAYGTLELIHRHANDRGISASASAPLQRRGFAPCRSLA